MAQSRSEFQISIKDTREGTGIADTQKGLKQLGETAQETGLLHQQSGEKAEEAGRETVKAGEKSTISHRELREAVHGVGRAFGEQIPGIGLWLNPQLAALAAVLASVEYLKKAWETLEAPALALNDALLALDASKLASAAESASALATALGEVADKASDLQASFDRGDTAMEDSIKLYGEKKDAIVKVAEAEEKAFEAELDHQSALNPARKEANDAAKEAARLALDSLRGQNDEAKLAFQIQQRENDFESARLRILGGNDRNAIIAAEKAAAGPEAAAKRAAAELAAAQKPAPIGIEGQYQYEDIDKARKAVLGLRQAAQEDEEVGATHAAEVFAKEARDLQAVIDQRENYVKNLQKLKDIADANAKHAGQDVANAKAQEEADQKLSIQGGARIKSLQDELAILQQVNADTLAAKGREAASREATQHVESANRALQSGEALFDRLSKGRSTPAEWEKMHDLLSRMLILTESNQGQLGTVGPKMQDLERKIENLEFANTQGVNTRSGQ